MKAIKTLGVIALLTYLAIGAYLYVFQRDFMYFPTPRYQHNYEMQQFSVDQETIDVVVLNNGMPDAIIYFGGNGEQVVGNAARFIHIFKEHTIYLVNYRGYGGSTGSPTEKALYSDSLSIHDRLIEKHKTISVIGRSLGTGIATYLAANRELDKVALVTPFDSILSIAQDQYPIFPLSLLLHDKYQSSRRVQNIDSPTIIILAEHDRVVPLRYSEKLIRQFPAAQVKVETIGDTGHNNLSQSGRYEDLLSEFFN